MVAAYYFKPFWFVLLGFILAIFTVSVHYWCFYKQTSITSTKLQSVSIHAQVEEVFSSDYIRIKLTHINEQPFPWYKQVFANVSIDIKKDAPSLKIGQQLKATAKLKQYRSRKNFDSFDSEVYAFTQKLHFKGRLIDFSAHQGQAHWLKGVYRSWLWHNLKDYKLSWLYYTLLSGDKSKISQQDKKQMQRLGLSHMLAISGLHIGIVFALTRYLSQGICFLAVLLGVRFCQSRDLNKYHAYAGLIGSTLYVLLSGLAVSALRALLMLCVLVMAYLFSKRVVNLRSLLFALCGVLLIDPFVVLNPGLYFSFIAVYGIFCCVRTWAGNRKKQSFLTQLFLLQLVLGLLLAPLSSYYFNGISVFALVTNMIFIPLLSFVILPSLLILVTSHLLGFMDGWFLLLDEYLFLLLELLVSWLIEVSWLKTSPFAWQYVIVFYLALLLITQVKIWRFIALIPVIIACVNSISQPSVKWQIDVFDVGHGTAVLVSTGKQALLYDIGAKYFDSFSIFERVIQPYLDANNLTLSHIVLSHQDNDHVGGVKELLAYAGKAPFSAFHNREVKSTCNITSLKMANTLHLESLWPTRPMLSDNNNSCVVKVSDGHYSLLLAGDIERDAEQLLVQQSATKLNSDILLVPHHGSNTSSTEAFIAAVDPQIAIYSRSYYSIWRLPHPQVVKRYAQADIRQLDTALEGHIRIMVTEHALQFEFARQAHRYWFL
ncbi:ComEC family protein [Pseudoalteromonas sp. A25]|nr:ComEC family protein [Pseudoalteromonas sp. A25]